MRLKTKLVLAMTALTFGVVLVLAIVFLGELLRQRIAQTAATNDVLAREVLLSTRQALISGLQEHPPADASDEAFQRAVADALRSYEPLSDEMNAIVRYSPTVQDVSISDAHGSVVVSTDPGLLNQHLPYRTPFAKTKDGGVLEEARAVFGHPQVLDLSLPLDRNGQAFLSVHIGIRSTFLRNSYAPWLQASLLFSALAMVGCLIVAAFLSNLALRPIETISQRLEQLTLTADASPESPLIEGDRTQALPDPVARASKSIERIGERIRTSEQVYSALQSNLNQMLDTLRDGVILFTADQRAIMVSEAVAGFLNRERDQILGLTADQIFDRYTAIGRAVREAFQTRTNVLEEKILAENGREVQMSIEFIHDDGSEGTRLGALLTLHDAESAEQLEREIEISRRLAAIGRLTAGVGHEVKNPINAMVLHLELLRNKLIASNGDACGGAQKHVDILSSEMQRLDRVVQQLADFSRPVELKLAEHDLRKIVQTVLELTAVSSEQAHVRLASHMPDWPLVVRVDEDLLRQALLNIFLNGIQAMPEGGTLRVELARIGQVAILRIIDTGTGIPPELLQKIFDLYFTTKPKGSGIGLAMTYRIVQLHGGSIDVISHIEPPDRGTTFTVNLPLDLSANSRRLPGVQTTAKEQA